MKQLKEPHNYKHVGIGMIAVAGSLAAIGILVLILHNQPFFSDSIMQEKIKQSEEMIKNATQKGNITGDKLAAPKPTTAILFVYLK